MTGFIRFTDMDNTTLQLIGFEMVNANHVSESAITFTSSSLVTSNTLLLSNAYIHDNTAPTLFGVMDCNLSLTIEDSRFENNQNGATMTKMYCTTAGCSPLLDISDSTFEYNQGLLFQIDITEVDSSFSVFMDSNNFLDQSGGVLKTTASPVPRRFPVQLYRCV